MTKKVMPQAPQFGNPTEIASALLSDPAQCLSVKLRDGAEIVVRRHGNSHGPRVVMSHGNGLAIDLYYPFWRHFLEHYDVVVYDFRNHGWNSTGDSRHHHFAAFVFDNECVLDAIAEHWGEKPALGVFHSLSAITAMYQAVRVGPRWAALVLFDPPVTPPPGHRLEGAFLNGQEYISERAARRQERYPDYADFEAVLRRASVFDGLSDECFALYAASTLRRSADGNAVELRCPREFEADIYVSNLDSTIALSMGSFPSPLKVIGGDPNRAGVTPPSLVCEALFPTWGIEFEYVADTGHFLQLEQPALCAQRTQAFFERQGFA